MSQPLADWIRNRIREQGPVPFARFMEWALYHPEHGYYTSGRARVGSDHGDFTTAPHMTPVFARCLARWVAAADRALGEPDPFVLVEGGAGEGRLARDLLDALRRREPGLYQRLRYAPHEASPAARNRLEETLAPHADRCVPPPERFTGVYLSNELLDALPVHRIRKGPDGLEEAFVDAVDGAFRETWVRPPSPPVLGFLDRHPIPLGGGWEAEVCPAALEWLAGVARRLERGYVLTVDYGDEADRLYGPHRPRGTCLAYRGHRTSGDLLDAPGLQDLTAHVNFTALRAEGRRLGLEPAPLLTQRSFLFAAGLVQEVESLERELPPHEALAARRALAPLLLPDAGMGDTFKALVQAKNAPLSGLPLDPLLPPGLS